VIHYTLLRKEEVKRQDELLEKAFKGVKGAVLTFTRKANTEGHLYAGVTREEIAEELAKAVGGAFTADHIMLDKPIKELGQIAVAATLADKTAQFEVLVKQEEE
jgi:ribosomal protein L9